MSESIDEFIQRFDGAGTVDDQEAANYHDKFVSGKPEDSQFDNRLYQSKSYATVRRSSDGRRHSERETEK